MAERIPIPFVGANAMARSGRVSNQRTVNLYPQLEKPGSKNVLALYSDPGLLNRVVAGLGPCRSNGVRWKAPGETLYKLYFVSGAELIAIDKSGSATTIGSLNTNGGRVVIDAGRNHLGLVDGSNGYSYDGTTFAAISDPDFPSNPTHIAWLDTYWMVNDLNTEQFYKSASSDLTDWDALEFASAESSPDNIAAIATSEKDLYCFGDETIEIFFNSGNPDFPFDPYTQGAIELGIAAPYSLTATSVGMFFLAAHKEGDISPMLLSGFSPVAISDDYIDWAISQMDVVEDAIGFSYKSAGHWFYQLTFPTEDKTLVYSVKEKLWHERKTPKIGRHRANGIGYLYRKYIVGDYSDGQFYELDFDTYTDRGEGMERIRRTQVIHKSNRRMTFFTLVIGFDTGVGLLSGQGSDPKAMLRYSDDGGKTWSDELFTSLGAHGDYDAAAVWTKLGQSRNRIFEVKVTDPVEVTIVDAYAEIELDAA